MMSINCSPLYSEESQVVYNIFPRPKHLVKLKITFPIICSNEFMHISIIDIQYLEHNTPEEYLNFDHIP